MLLSDLELTPDNSHVEGICEECFEERQSKKSEAELMDNGFGVPCPPEISRMIAALESCERKKIRGLIRRTETPHPE